MPRRLDFFIGSLAMTFYREASPQYSIVDSMNDSLRFTTRRCLDVHQGNLCATSTFVDPWGEPARWHYFGEIEGVVQHGHGLNPIERDVLAGVRARHCPGRGRGGLGCTTRTRYHGHRRPGCNTARPASLRVSAGEIGIVVRAYRADRSSGSSAWAWAHTRTDIRHRRRRHRSA